MRETTIEGNNAVKNEVMYTGGVYDKISQQYYLNARHYDPQDGVFLTQDSFRGEFTEPITWSRHGYCAGNPINYIDSTGHIPIVLVIAAPYVGEGLLWAGGAVLAWGIGTEISHQQNKVQNDTIAVPAPAPKPSIRESVDKDIRKIIDRALVIKNKTSQNKKKFFEMHMSKLPDSGKMIAVIGKKITEAKAVRRLRNKKDTVTWFGHNAKRIALKAGNGKVRPYDELEKKKAEHLFPHYHPRGKPSHSAYVFGPWHY